MANVAFYRGTSIPTTSTLSDGGIYFNTSNKYIYLNSGGTLHTFKGTDTNNIPVYTSIGQSTSISKASAYIQDLPTTTSASSTEGASSITWYNWVGQGVVSHSTFGNAVYDHPDWDQVMSSYKSLPPIAAAKEIVVAISPYYLAYHANGESSATGMSYLPTGQVVVRCYRTTQEARLNEAPTASHPTTGALFEGHTAGISGHSSSTSNGKSVQFYDITLRLCRQAGNAIYASLASFEIAGGSNTNTGGSFYAVSGDYPGEFTPRPNIEKYVYPLFIRY